MGKSVDAEKYEKCERNFLNGDNRYSRAWISAYSWQTDEWGGMLRISDCRSQIDLDFYWDISREDTDDTKERCMEKIDLFIGALERFREALESIPAKRPIPKSEDES